MRGLVAGVLIGGAIVFAPPLVSACILPPRHEGEGSYEHFVRIERPVQRRLLRAADGIYLARAIYVPENQRSVLSLIVRILGATPPKRSVVHDGAGDCLGVSGAEGVYIVFAERIDFHEAPWTPWRWGRWEVIDLRVPSAVVEAELAVALKKAADELKRD